MLVVHRRHRKITFLVPRLVTEIRADVAAGVPRAFFRIYEIESVVVTLIETNVVENVELDLGSPVTRVRNSGGLQILFSFLGHESRIAAIRLTGDRIAHIGD